MVRAIGHDLVSHPRFDELAIELHAAAIQVWAITDAGTVALGSLRLSGLSEIVVKPDPFDLALTRLDPDHLDDLPATIAARIAALSAMLVEHEAHTAAIARYLTLSESMVMKHAADRLLLHNIRFWRSYWASRRPQSVAMLSHADLIAALEARDQESAERAMRQHITASRQVLLQRF